MSPGKIMFKEPKSLREFVIYFPEMQELHSVAIETGLCLVNEVGLDPGIDHLMAHTLIEDYRNSKDQDDENDISFFSTVVEFQRLKTLFAINLVGLH